MNEYSNDTMVILCEENLRNCMRETISLELYQKFLDMEREVNNRVWGSLWVSIKMNTKGSNIE